MNGMLRSPVHEITNYRTPIASHAHPNRRCRSSGETANDR